MVPLEKSHRPGSGARWWLRWFISRCGEIDLLGGGTGVWLAEGRCSSAHNLIKSKELPGESRWWRCEHFRAKMGGFRSIAAW